MKKKMLILVLFVITFLVLNEIPRLWADDSGVTTKPCPIDHKDGMCFGHSIDRLPTEMRVEDLEKKVVELEARVTKLEPEPALIFVADANATIWITEPDTPTKPYLHKNPNNDHWICSNHGDLRPNEWLSENVIVFDDTTYCYICFYDEVVIKLINQHLTGVKENN